MEKILDERILEQITAAFEKMKEPVEILFFGARENCEYCAETQQLLEEVSAVDGRIGLKVYDIKEDSAIADSFNVKHAPGIVIAARDGETVRDLGIQYSGIPSGHEFGTLINDIVLVSGRDSGLSAATRAYLKGLVTPLHLQVFVTPTCPHCPRAVLLAHQIAMENPAMIRAEGVEATEFPELANQFNVRGVPQTVINAGRGVVVGALPETNLLAEIMRAVN